MVSETAVDPSPSTEDKANDDGIKTEVTVKAAVAAEAPVAAAAEEGGFGDDVNSVSAAAAAVATNSMAAEEDGGVNDVNDVNGSDQNGGSGDGEVEDGAKATDNDDTTNNGVDGQPSQVYKRAYRSANKRPRLSEDDGDGDGDDDENIDDDDDDDDSMDEDPTTPTAPTGPRPNYDVQQAILKFKRKKGTCYDVTYTDDESSSAGKGTQHPYGIKLATVKIKSVHSYLPHYYEAALGEKYRGRPPTASDQAIVVQGIAKGSASPTTMDNIRRNDILLLMDTKLVNITEKKQLKYYKARMNNGSRPMILTFFRPDEGEEEDPVDEEELDQDEALYVTKYEPAECSTWTAPAYSTSSKVKAATISKEDRQTRRALLERRLEELEVLLVETSTELGELRIKDGVLAAGGNVAEPSETKISVTSKDDFAIPPHIMYYPPMKLRRKKLPALHQACNKVENLLRHRLAIDKEAEKIRQVVKQGQMRLAIKDKELEALDKKIAPELEQLKVIEMEVQDNWKGMYEKLKDYYLKHGHSNVAEKENTKLAKWITRQRTCYANAQLEKPNPSMGIIKPYQYDLLNRLEFCWNPREQQFIQNVTMLIAYKQQHGHTNVPMKHENIHLANFVQKWRREHRLFQEGKPCNMSQDRLQVLEEAGFTWRDPSRTRKRSDTRQETWDGFLSQLEAFKSKYGHFMVNKVNKSLEKGNRLGRLDEFCGWIRKQFTLYKEGSPCQLTDEKVNQLKEMGFWLERGQSHRYALEQKAANAKNNDEEDATPEEEDDAIQPQLGELQVPKIEEINFALKKALEAAAKEGDEDMADAADTTMV